MKERVLIVEDESIVLLDIKNRLRNFGYDIVGTTAYGEEAIIKAVELRPDIVLMDISLKGNMNGIEAAGKIRKLCNTPIIYLTANSDYKSIEQAKVTEPYGHVFKPFDDINLRVSIDMAIYKHGLDIKLNDSRKLLESTLRNIGEAVITTDERSRVTFMNRIAVQMTGWEINEALNKNVCEIFHLSDPVTGRRIDFPVDMLLNGINTGSSFYGMMLASRTGVKCEVDSHISGIMKDDGSYSGMVITVKDISEKLKAEKDLYENRRFLTTLISNLPGMVYRCNLDRDWAMQFISEGCYHMTGYQPDDLIGNNKISYNSIIHPDDRETVGDTIQKAVARKKPYQFSYRITTATGVEKWVWEQGCVILSPEQEVVALEGFITDITEQKLSTETLRESEEKFRALAEMSCAMIIVHSGDKFLYVNHEATNITGYSGEELLNMHFSAIFRPDCRQEIIDRATARLQGQQVMKDYETVIQTRDGRSKRVHIVAKTFVYRRNLSVISTVFDISKDKR